MKEIEVLASHRYRHSDVVRASSVRAGNWIFLNGIDATQDLDEAAQALGSPELPYHGLPKYRREGDLILDRAASLLAGAGSDFSNSVRLDQYYRTWKAVDPYHIARKASFGKNIPPSTSVVMDDLPDNRTAISCSLIAVVSGVDLEPIRIEPPNVTSPEWSGFAPAVRSGDYVFIAGIMARGSENQSDPRAHVPSNSRWGGYEIRRQSEFIIEHKLKPALAAAGSSPANVVKAQVYLRDIDDLPHFMDVWESHFGQRQCALTILPGSDFGLVDGNIEINLIALTDAGETKKVLVPNQMPETMCFGAPAVRAGDLLFFSGLHATDVNGPIPAVRRAESLPHMGISGNGQTAFILEQIEQICREERTSLSNAARLDLFLTNLGDFPAVHQAWNEFLPSTPLPSSVIQTPAPHPVPRCSLIVDAWVYAP